MHPIAKATYYPDRETATQKPPGRCHSRDGPAPGRTGLAGGGEQRWRGVGRLSNCLIAFEESLLFTLLS